MLFRQTKVNKVQFQGFLFHVGRNCTISTSLPWSSKATVNIYLCPFLFFESLTPFFGGFVRVVVVVIAAAEVVIVVLINTYSSLLLSLLFLTLPTSFSLSMLTAFFTYLSPNVPTLSSFTAHLLLSTHSSPDTLINCSLAAHFKPHLSLRQFSLAMKCHSSDPPNTSLPHSLLLRAMFLQTLFLFSYLYFTLKYIYSCVYYYISLFYSELFSVKHLFSYVEAGYVFEFLFCQSLHRSLFPFSLSTQIARKSF